jgi:hypothetical protein
VGRRPLPGVIAILRSVQVNTTAIRKKLPSPIDRFIEPVIMCAFDCADAMEIPGIFPRNRMRNKVSIRLRSQFSEHKPPES